MVSSVLSAGLVWYTSSSFYGLNSNSEAVLTGLALVYSGSSRISPRSGLSLKGISLLKM